jgi:hypothetical protein
MTTAQPVSLEVALSLSRSWTDFSKVTLLKIDDLEWNPLPIAHLAIFCPLPIWQIQVTMERPLITGFDFKAETAHSENFRGISS